VRRRGRRRLVTGADPFILLGVTTPKNKENDMNDLPPHLRSNLESAAAVAAIVAVLVKHKLVTESQFIDLRNQMRDKLLADIDGRCAQFIRGEVPTLVPR
jgi:hypothetical protein